LTRSALAKEKAYTKIKCYISYLLLVLLVLREVRCGRKRGLQLLMLMTSAPFRRLTYDLTWMVDFLLTA
jgi:hypothetical protein